MGSEFRPASIGEIAAPIPNATAAGPFGSNLVSRDYVESGVPVIRGQNLADRWIGGVFVYVSQEKAATLRTNTARPGDIVFTQRGTLGQVSLVPADAFPVYVISQSQMKLTVDPAKADGGYVYYACTSNDFIRQVHDNAVAAGVPHINLGTLRGLRIPLPSLETQKAIAGTLAALDDRIDNLCQTNITLEAIAQALFKSWFVDFDPVHAKVEGREPEAMDAATAALFPSEFEESELGLIPKGWPVKPFGDCVTILGGGTPKTSIPEYWGGDIPWFSVVDAPMAGQVFTLGTAKKITPLGLENCSAKLLPRMTTIISARGTVGKVALTASEMAMNQSCYGLRSIAAGGEAFVYFSTLRFVDHLQQIAHGAVFDTITRSSFDQVSACRPPDSAIARFGSLAKPLLERIRINGCQAMSLAALRDTLLPRLISGKLRLPDAEREIEAVV